MQRFWDKVDKTSGHGPRGECWIWTAKLRSKKTGYGAIKVKGETIDTHRFSFFLTHGKIPKGYDVCHKCDFRICVRPTHLFLGTRSDNMQDASRKGRMRLGPLHFNQQARGESAGSSKLKVDDVLFIIDNPEIDGPSLSLKFGVDRAQISRIRKGITWRHITGL